MCGITGYFATNTSKEQRERALSQMLEAQKHRGPDAMQLWQDNYIALGHNRLSIIDLSEQANQPMRSACNRFVIVFNGEIYNYIEIKKELQNDFFFQTQSDTEVLLNAYLKWGKAMLSKLNGMFSIAIWDTDEKKLFLARDRFGVKPLYYYWDTEKLVFASEIKAIWASGVVKTKNHKVWANYLSYGTYGLPQETFWDSIHQIPAGHFAIVQQDNFYKVQPTKWYDFVANIDAIPEVSASKLKEEYVALLQDAIQLRFRADVPLGMNVSGGLDSSTLIALIHNGLPSSKNMEAFTFYSNDTNYDELPWVTKLMEGLPYSLHKVLFKSSEIPDLIPKMSWVQEEPFGGFPTLAYSLLFQEARKIGVKVLLDGQGMDEAWAGYDYYHNNSNAIIQGVQSSPVRPEVLHKEFADFAQKEVYPEPFESKIKNLQYRDIFYTKIPRALRFNDRISMFHGTELREPFLDYRIVELAFAQKDALKFQNGNTKWMLRQIAEELTSKQISLAPKRALQTPQREWIAGPLRDYVTEQITHFAALDFVHKDKVFQIWQEYLHGKQDNSFYIWQWINIAALV